MKELRLGKVAYKELAEWFGITIIHSSQKERKLEELKLFCNFELTKSGKVNILEIYEPVYVKQKEKVEELSRQYLKYFTSLNSNQFLGTISQAATNIVNEYKLPVSIKYVTRYISKVLHEEYGYVNKEKGIGTKGIMQYVKCKCSTDAVAPKCYPLSPHEIEDLTIILNRIFNSEEYEKLISDIHNEELTEEQIKEMAALKYKQVYKRTLEYFKGEYYLILRGTLLTDMEKGEI